MDKRYQTAPCGLDCFNCSSHKANITDEKKKELAASFNISPDEVGCKGCRDMKGKCHALKKGEDCATWVCTQKRGVTYCYECEEFPCGLLAPSSKEVWRPHNMKVYNLCRMKLLGIDGWIDEVENIRNRYYNGEFVVGKGPVLETE